MNKVKMLKTTLGCDAGVIYPTNYVEGKEYTIGDSLLKAFVDLAVVELVSENNTAEKRDTKVVRPEETKVVTPAEKKKLLKKGK